MVNFEKELAHFISQTAKIDIFSVGAETYACYRKFIIDALQRLNHEMSPLNLSWLSVAQRASRESASAKQIEETRKSIVGYRKNNLGLESFSIPASKDDALCILFMLAIEEWPRDPATEAKTSVVQAIDEFTSIYIEFFGHGQELVQILKDSFYIK